jgi:hypothetical protein
MRKHAERRIGQIIIKEKKAGTLAKAGRKPEKNRDRNGPNFPSLADRGVDKNLADRSRKAAAMPDQTGSVGDPVSTGFSKNPMIRRRSSIVALPFRRVVEKPA